jgi:hypothetical protein
MSEIVKTKYQNLVDFICEDPGYFSFLHTTDTIEKAKSICENGFRFKKFDKTSDYVCDAVTLTYMLNIRKHYGDFTVILQISKDTPHYEKISEMEYDDEGEEVFVLPPQYIKGYYNRITNEIVANSLFEK